MTNTYFDASNANTSERNAPTLSNRKSNYNLKFVKEFTN